MTNERRDADAPRHNKKIKKQKSFFSLVNWKWVGTAFLTSVVLSIVLSLLSSELLDYIDVIFSLLILFFFIALGVTFDIIGLAFATADPAPFNSMAAQKVRGGKTAVRMIKNADRVSSFCNDIVGDICGIVSGSTATAIALKMVAAASSQRQIWMNLLICGVVSALTVGLKAIGKAAGLNYSKEIVTFVARVVSLFRPEFKSGK
ncbi:MAG: CNNM domain-containing protein [Clostridia bacterium]|nr:CNNM domain-containing protein [Clostridia bacterium]